MIIFLSFCEIVFFLDLMSLCLTSCMIWRLCSILVIWKPFLKEYSDSRKLQIVISQESLMFQQRQSEALNIDHAIDKKHAKSSHRAQSPLAATMRKKINKYRKQKQKQRQKIPEK